MKIFPGLYWRSLRGFKSYGMFFMVLFFAGTAGATNADHCGPQLPFEDSWPPQFNGVTSFTVANGPSLPITRAFAMGLRTRMQTQAHDFIKSALPLKFANLDQTQAQNAFGFSQAIDKAILIYGIGVLKPEDRAGYADILLRLPAAQDPSFRYDGFEFADPFGGRNGRIAYIELAQLNLELAMIEKRGAVPVPMPILAKLEHDPYLKKIEKLQLKFRQQSHDGELKYNLMPRLLARLNYIKANYLKKRDAREAIRLYQSVSSYFEEHCQLDFHAFALISVAQTQIDDVLDRRAKLSNQQLFRLSQGLKQVMYAIDLLPNTSLDISKALLVRKLQVRVSFHALELLKGDRGYNGQRSSKEFIKNNNTCALLYFMKIGKKLGIELELPKGTVIDPAFTQKCYDLPL